MNDLLEFLKDLSQNNNKPWFENNKKRYDKVKSEFIEIVQEIIDQIKLFEPEINSISAKNCLFRINRDVRFSPDKSPYKSNFGASLNPYGKKSPKAGYYLHIKPSESFVGGGIYMPEPDILKKIRQEIDYNFEEFKKIIDTNDFKTTYTDLMEEDKLSRPPKGYEPDNPAIEYIKNKHFVCIKNIGDSIIIDRNQLINESVQAFKTLKPFNDFLNRTFDD